MSEYITETYGPGDIAALPPTIGMTSRAPTIGAEDAGHPIQQAFPFQQHSIPGATRVEAAGVQLPVNGLGFIRPTRASLTRRPHRARWRRPMQLSGMGAPIAPIVPVGIRQRYGLLGLGAENGNGEMPAWALPVGIGLVLGGLYVYFTKQKEGGLFANMGEPTCNSCGPMHKNA